jgi:superfamily II DNA/RNA helicase
MKVCSIVSHTYTPLFYKSSASASLGYSVVALNGGDSVESRRESIRRVRAFEARVLVATDVAARGVDIDRVDLVVHAEMPREGETFLHRSGRAGRFGTRGAAVIVAGPADAYFLDALLARYPGVAMAEGHGPTIDERAAAAAATEAVDEMVDGDTRHVHAGRHGQSDNEHDDDQEHQEHRLDDSDGGDGGAEYSDAESSSSWGYSTCSECEACAVCAINQ